jgi:hypothetical protein
MRTRADARRGGEAAAAVAAAATPAARHAVLLALLLLRNCPAHVLEAALAAIGPPGSAAVLAALSHGDHSLLREACRRRRPDAVAPLLRAYGDSPDACAAAVRILSLSSVLQLACYRGDAETAAALLAVYRRAGRAHEALAADDHWALRYTGYPDITALVLAEYGEPGSDAVLAALAADGHGALRSACKYGRSRSVALLAAAYGPPGCAALRKAVADENGLVLMDIFFEHCRRSNRDRLAAYDATLSALLSALAELDNATALRALGSWLEAPIRAYTSDPAEPAERLVRIPPDSVLARLAVAAPAAWALNPDAARALLSAPVRASLALPRLLAVRRLPAGVAEPLAAHLRAQPWLLFAGSRAEMEVG